MIKISPKVWPIGITLGIIGVAGLCVWTVKIAQSMPVEMDNSYFASYRDVDLNANEMLLKQNAFEKNYSVSFDKEQLILGENSITIHVTDKQNQPINDATLDVVLTKPHTTNADQALEVDHIENGNYFLKPFSISEESRWQIQTKITVGDLLAFYKTEFLTPNAKKTDVRE